jgi:transcriptional regulator with XRE-family HTH domain
MSDVYLVVRHRLSDVVDWAELGVTVMRNARKRKGLSYETMGREINVSGKTYERYEKAGRVPRHLLPRVAAVLDLEIEMSEPQRVVVTPAEETAQRDLVEIRASIARIERLVRELLEPPRDDAESA